MATSVLASETRNGNRLICRQMLNLIGRIGEESALLSEYDDRIRAGLSVGNPAVAFSVFAFERGISPEECFLMYGYSIASTMVQNAVRSMPLGQGDGQVILNRAIDVLAQLFPESSGLDASYLGANVPGLELAQILHETQVARLFMS